MVLLYQEQQGYTLLYKRKRFCLMNESNESYIREYYNTKCRGSMGGRANM